MDIAAMSNLSTEHQEIFNRVRINLRLLTLSDIVVADSTTKILPDIIRGISHRSSNFNWPMVQNLPQSWIKIFANIIKNVIRPHLMNKRLGKWIGKGHQSWHHYKGLDQSIVTSDTEIDTFTPVDITLHRRRPIIGYKPLPSPPIQRNPIPDNPATAIRQAPHWMRQLWRGVCLKNDSIHSLASTIEHDNLCIFGDGYVKDQRGAFTWCYANKTDFITIFENSGPVDDDPMFLKSARTEASHVLAALSLLFTI